MSKTRSPKEEPGKKLNCGEVGGRFSPVVISSPVVMPSNMNFSCPTGCSHPTGYFCPAGYFYFTEISPFHACIFISGAIFCLLAPSFLFFLLSFRCCKLLASRGKLLFWIFGPCGEIEIVFLAVFLDLSGVVDCEFCFACSSFFLFFLSAFLFFFSSWISFLFFNSPYAEVLDLMYAER